MSVIPMRVLVGVIVLAACDAEERADGSCDYNGKRYEAGQTWAEGETGDGCNICSCSRGDALCTLKGCLDAGVDASPSCAPSAGCLEGPACGTDCCAAGERCAGTLCVCGDDNLLCRKAADEPPTTCGAGTVGTCGSTCCGGSNGPC